MGGDRTANVAGLLTRVASAAGGQAHANQQTPGQESSVLDVWSHSYDGMSQRLNEVASDPASLVTNRIDLARAMATGLTGGGAGTTHGEAVDSMAAQMEGLGDGLSAISRAEGALATIGATFAFLTSIEQMISTAFSIIPFPAFPALRVLDIDVGLPHAHNHPPNLTPPNPVPVPLPSTGPVIPIPILSGATKTLINGMPAARCGDMGLGVWCGGYFPMYEVFLGSSSVWIEGARASRLAVDITKHCIFTCPKPSDPPIGPMIGFTTLASTNVLIGGVPMPSLLSLGVGAAFKGLFAGARRIVQRLRGVRRAAEAADDVGKHLDELAQGVPAGRFSRRGLARAWQGLRRVGRSPRQAFRDYLASRRLVRALEDSGAVVIQGDRGFRRLARQDLRRIASSPVARETLDDLFTSGNTVTIREAAPNAGNGCTPASMADATSPAAGGTGRGSDSVVDYHARSRSARSTSTDTSLNHEMRHARNASRGEVDTRPPADPIDQQRFPHREEQSVIEQWDNPYRTEQGAPNRYSHSDIS